MKTTRHLTAFLLVITIFTGKAHAQEEIYLPPGAPLKALFTTMKRQCLTGKLKPISTGADSTAQFVYKQTVSAPKAGLKTSGDITITMGITQKRITALEALTKSASAYITLKEQAGKAYAYTKSMGDEAVSFDTGIANVMPTHRVEKYTFPHGTGAVFTHQPKGHYTYRLLPVLQCLRIAADIPSGANNHIIQYPLILPFGKSIANLSNDRGKFIEMSPNTYRLPLKEIFDGSRAGIYMEALALEAGDNLTGKQIGIRRLLTPEEAGIPTRDILGFNILTDHQHQLTGMKSSFRFRATYDAIYNALSAQGQIPESVEINEATILFYFHPQNNLCLILFAAEPYETKGTRGIYNLQALNHSLGKVLYELICFHKSQLIKP